MTTRRQRICVTGVVQGVGFRPFVHSAATSRGLIGFVGNDDTGVFIEVEGSSAALTDFIEILREDHPPLARVDTVHIEEIPSIGGVDFTIVESRRSSGTVTLIPPDTAVCEECWRDVMDPTDRRYRYPFTTCTHCGPRYTLITGLPYDRPHTTMASFTMCAACEREYTDVGDRRFHAQPIACPECGPRLTFTAAGISVGDDAALGQAITALHNGRIVAIKGIGGYHLACDARNPEAVNVLRRRKQRGSKPFAVMVANLEVAETLVHLSDDLRSLLMSREAPIVLVPARDHALQRSLAPGQDRIGVMLAYSPLHRLLFTAHPDLSDVPVASALVMTSGNLADEPLCIAADEAEERLTGIADGFLHHNRPIHVSCDDSVIAETGQPVRRSRGFAPLPIRLAMKAPSMLAVGGELKTTLCLADGQRAWLSQHIGDTSNWETLALLERTARTMGELLRINPEIVVTDQHPGYLSRRWGMEFAATIGAQTAAVQHHHAHLASLLAEHHVDPDVPVIGFTFDGTGYGDDGTIWGGEILLGTYAHTQRMGHLRPIQLPGGDAATARPARTALAHLHGAGIPPMDSLPPVLAMDANERRVVEQMLATGSHCTPTSSMGRLFDAVSSLLDVCHSSDYEGQAAIELEMLAQSGHGGPGDGAFHIDEVEGCFIADPAPLLRDLVASMREGRPRPDLAWRFHEAVAQAVARLAEAIRDRSGVNTAGLTGGVFANRTLETLCREKLEACGFTVLVHRAVPPNDGGLALGQTAVIASRSGG
jgi:hydrogenase maturation protein HypF